jgi:DDE family transposase
MLLLADRNFPGYELWGLAAATGANLAWQIKKNLVFPPVKVLPDGSFHSVMRTPAENVRHGQARAAGRVPEGPADGHLVRVIEYTVTITGSGSTRTEPFRLVTTLLDHEQAPAAQLAAMYHQRWEIENSHGELKTRLRGASFILRSRSPELVRQELYAFLTVYQALCALKAEAARTAGVDPDRISFTVTVRVARDHVASHPSPASPGPVPGAKPGHPGHPR